MSLDATQEKILQDLIAQDPDKALDPEDRRFLIDMDGQREALGCLMNSLELIRKWSPYIRPMHFENEAHQTAYRCLSEFVEQHDALPSKAQMAHAIKTVMKDSAHSTYYLAEFSTVWEYYRDTATTGSINKMLHRFVDDAMFVVGWYKVNDARLKGIPRKNSTC